MQSGCPAAQPGVNRTSRQVPVRDVSRNEGDAEPRLGSGELASTMMTELPVLHALRAGVTAPGAHTPTCSSSRLTETTHTPALYKWNHAHDVPFWHILYRIIHPARKPTLPRCRPSVTTTSARSRQKRPHAQVLIPHISHHIR